MAAVASVYPLETTLAAILARLVSRGEAVAQENATTSDLETPMWCKGVDWVQAIHAPPRYVWFPTGITPAPPHKGDISNQERALITGLEAVEVHCWGKDAGQAWALRRNLFRALQNQAPTAWQYQGDEILLNGGGLGTMGVVNVVRLAFYIPVTDDPDTIVVPVAVNLTGKLVVNENENTGCQATVE